VLTPHAGWRARVVAYGAPPGEAPVVASASTDANDEPTAAPNARHWAWAALMRRAFEIDVLACPRCGGVPMLARPGRVLAVHAVHAYTARRLTPTESGGFVMTQGIAALLMVVALTIGGVMDARAAIVFDTLTGSAGPSSLTGTVAAHNTITSSTLETATVTVTNTDYLLPLGAVLGQFTADAVFTTGTATFTLSGYADTTNTQGGTEILVGATQLTGSFVGPPVPFTVGGPYSLALIATFTLNPGAAISFTDSVVVTQMVSEPAVTTLLAVALLGGVIITGLRHMTNAPRARTSRSEAL